MRKKIGVKIGIVFISALVAVVAVLLNAAVISHASSSGTTGDCTWTLEDNVLTISGNGAMADLEYDEVIPWGTSYKKVVIKEGVTKIGDNSFSFSEMESVDIASSVNEIGWEAFSGCKSLKSIEIPARVTELDVFMFAECSGLESLKVDSNNPIYYSEGNCIIEKESKELFLGCKNSQIPDGVTKIGMWAFAHSQLTNIEIPNSVTEIGSRAFAYSESLESVKLSGKMTGISEGLFQFCTSLKSIAIPEGITYVSERAFAGSGLVNVDLPNSLIYLYDFAFQDCSDLESIVIPDSVEYIGSYAFDGCSNLTHVELSKSITKIAECTFRGCNNLISIEIPESVTEIVSYAFMECNNLKDVWYHGSEEQKSEIAIGLYNESLLNATWHYNSHFCEWSDWAPVAGTNNHSRTCKDPTCGKTETVAHGWDKGTETKAPKCAETGVTTYTCAECKATKTEDIAVLGHDWSSWVDDGKNATTDTHSHTCKRNCGVAVETQNHKWSAWVTNGDVNHKKTCSVCAGTRTAEHNWDEGVLTDAPSEEKEGETTYTCIDCGQTKTESVDKLEHTHNWSDWTQNNETSHTRSCRCNEIQTENHNFDSGVVVNVPTHLTMGETRYTCADCGYTKSEIKPALKDHEWGKWTDNKNGTHTRTCICEVSETKAHVWSSWNVQNDGNYKRQCADCATSETMTLPSDKPVNTTSNNNAANTNLTNKDIELIEKVLTDKEQSQVADGAEVNVYLKVEDISNEAPAEHKTEAEAKAGNNEIGMYLDIDLFKKVGSANETQVTEIAGAVKITITIPEELINTDASVTRTYKIIRVHEDENGKLITDVIEGVFNPADNTFTFESDKFSTYALAYADNRATNTPAGPNSPQTGDNSNMMLWIALLFVSGFGVVGTTLYGKKKLFVK